MELWDNVKGFYKEKFDIEPEIVELFCDFSVLLLCASGSGNLSIANILDMDLDEVKLIIHSYLEFDGWEKDLEYNPLKLYKDNILFIYDKDVFQVCAKFLKLEKLLNDNWI